MQPDCLFAWMKRWLTIEFDWHLNSIPPSLLTIRLSEWNESHKQWYPWTLTIRSMEAGKQGVKDKICLQQKKQVMRFFWQMWSSGRYCLRGMYETLKFLCRASSYPVTHSRFYRADVNDRHPPKTIWTVWSLTYLVHFSSFQFEKIWKSKLQWLPYFLCRFPRCLWSEITRWAGKQEKRGDSVVKSSTR